MAYTKNRSVRLLQKIKKSPFVKMNNEVYGGTSRILGASNLAENSLLANGNLLKTLLPTVLGVDINGGKWQNIVSKYLYAINIDVPKGGKTFDISLIFDLNDERTRRNIDKLLVKYKKKITTDEALADFILGYDKVGNKIINEIDYYLYATPVNNLDYFNFIYCTLHNRVANKQEFVNKSSRIDFYLVTKEDVEKEKRTQFSLSKRINKALLKLDEDSELFDAICSILNITSGDTIDKSIILDKKAHAEPEQVLSLLDDKHVMLKAKIENYIRKGILKRLPNSSMIVDASDPSLIIGDTLNSAITFFSDSKNDGHINQYAAKNKSLN